MIIGLSRVPLTKTINVYVASIPLALAWRDHGIGWRVLLVEAHVACWGVVTDNGRLAGGGDTLAGRVIVGIFCSIIRNVGETMNMVVGKIECVQIMYPHAILSIRN